MTALQICDEFVIELVRAHYKHPKPFNSAHEGYAIILEELEEAWEEIKKQERNNAKVRKEMIQVGAMAIRFIQDVSDLQRKMRSIDRDCPVCKAPAGLPCEVDCPVNG